MNTYFLIAGILCFILGLVHSILGEILIFNHKRNKGSIVPTNSGVEWREEHLRIIWATWHLASLFGWCIGVLLIKISLMQDQLDQNFTEVIVLSMVGVMLVSSLLVFWGTRGKHLGWIVLLLIGGLLMMGKG